MKWKHETQRISEPEHVYNPGNQEKENFICEMVYEVYFHKVANENSYSYDYNEIKNKFIKVQNKTQ